MTTKAHRIDVSGMPVEIVRKDIKNLHLAVYPPDGRIRVAAPLRVDEDAIRLAVISRLGWIRRRRIAFQAQDRQSEREMITGETHYVQGRPYRLDVIESVGPVSVSLRNNKRLELRVRPGMTRKSREVLLRRWYRQRLHGQVAELIAKWEPVVGTGAFDWRIKRMKTHWGTCSIASRRIWLNLELAKKPSSCVEYILVHEMVHLLERHHNDRFKEHMNRFMPHWRRCRDELNRAPLSHEDWLY